MRLKVYWAFTRRGFYRSTAWNLRNSTEAIVLDLYERRGALSWTCVMLCV